MQALDELRVLRVKVGPGEVGRDGLAVMILPVCRVDRELHFTE